MIQNDIDLLEEDTYQDPYYFALRLLSLKKNKRKSSNYKKNCHFKFLIEQESYVIDQTKQIQNVFWIIKTSCISLNKQTLHFFVPDLNNTNTNFQLKMYLISHEEVQQIATLAINTLTYIQVLLEYGKTIFRQTVSLCLEYSLEYQIYIDKNKLQLENMLKNNKEQNYELKNAFKKKTHKIIEVQNQKVQVKHKNSSIKQTQVLRKSLHFDMNKLIQVKKKNQQLKQKYFTHSASHNSLLSKIGDIFRSKTTQKSQFQFQQNLQGKNKKADSQRSCTISPPCIGPHKYNRPQNKFYYHSLQIQRQKEKQRIKSYANVKSQQSQTKLIGRNSYLHMLKIIVTIFLVSFVIYYLSSPSKKGRFKNFKNLDWLKL